jgi:hypothetical protein
MPNAILADMLWELALIAGVIFLSGFGLGALAHHAIWGRTKNSG